MAEFMCTGSAAVPKRDWSPAPTPSIRPQASVGLGSWSGAAATMGKTTPPPVSGPAPETPNSLEEELDAAKVTGGNAQGRRANGAGTADGMGSSTRVGVAFAMAVKLAGC